MTKLFLILLILLFSQTSYAKDVSSANPDKDTAYTEQGEAAGDMDVDTEERSDQDLYELDEEDPDMYGYGTGERELNVEDYGVGDTGEDSIEE